MNKKLTHHYAFFAGIKQNFTPFHYFEARLLFFFSRFYYSTIFFAGVGGPGEYVSVWHLPHGPQETHRTSARRLLE